MLNLKKLGKADVFSTNLISVLFLSLEKSGLRELLYISGLILLLTNKNKKE